MFATSYAKSAFYDQLKDFVSGHGIGVDSPKTQSAHEIKEWARTKMGRQRLLEKFFRAVFAHVSSALVLSSH